jgi:3',5'-cyclic AMP phosphodiesterase CpdA
MTPKKIIHLSDLHVRDRGTEFSRALRVFDAVSRYYPGSPVLVTGDLTDSGEPEQMDCARTLLDRLAATNPVLAVPGNHDYAWKGLFHKDKAWQQWVKRLGSPLGWPGQPPWVPWLTVDVPPGVDGLGVWDDPGGELVYFGVDSGDPEDKVNTARGYVSKGLAAGLKRELRKRAGKCRVVMLHHHPFDDGAFMKLVGAERLLDAVRGNCEILLFGHDHHLGLWRGRDGVPIIVASHKTTDEVFEHHLMISIIEVNRDAKGVFSFWHRLELA